MSPAQLKNFCKVKHKIDRYVGNINFVNVILLMKTSNKRGLQIWLCKQVLITFWFMLLRYMDSLRYLEVLRRDSIRSS